ncbi:MAG: hypothetical protein DHS20C09_03310 [marine bacterium B5-7]|nr:MAG: hypothetical protein DHS20C09_03310 [marine bacterium B5-7]
MLKTLYTLNKTFYVEWTPDDVCEVLNNNAITANELVQSNKLNTKKLVREFYLLACRASLKPSASDHMNAIVLNRYARAMKLISREYEKLFWSSSMSNSVQQSVEEPTNNNIDKLQARLFYLITQYSENQCSHIAGHIVNLLTSLCRHPHIDLMPAQHYIYSNSINYWRSRLSNNGTSVNKQELH